MTTKLLFVHAHSPLHAGTGQGVGVVDLPIAREKATNLPYLPGSSLKGALRARCTDAALQKALFGPDTLKASEHAGCLQFSDQRLLLLPVRSLAGTFAYATSAFILQRFARDVQGTGGKTPSVPRTPDAETALVSSSTALKISGQVVLEDLSLSPADSPGVDEWGAWLGEHVGRGDAAFAVALKERLIILPDDIFNFLARHGTEVVARIALDAATKTVKESQLWYEESLPAESILSGLVLGETVRQGKSSDAPRTTAEEALKGFGGLLGSLGLIQLGGKATVGRGLCRLALAEG